MVASHDDVLRAFFQNSHERFTSLVPKYVKDPSNYDAKAYSRNGPRAPDYSHLQHLSWIYANQIRLLENLLNGDSSRNVRILDLGTCGGDFILSSAKYFATNGELFRVEYVAIDWSSQDMRFGEEMARAIPGLRANWVVADISAPGFADRLRRYHPDVIVANHILEHLPVDDIMNRYLQDWLLAAKVPIGSV